MQSSSIFAVCLEAVGLMKMANFARARDVEFYIDLMQKA